MSIRYSFLAVALIAALVATPAHADGKKSKPLVTPPSALKVQPRCSNGQMGRFDKDGRIICPAVTRRVVPQQPKVTRIVQKAAPTSLKLDMAGFNGGVGSTIGTSFYGGGGGYIYVPQQRYSGVLSHSAAALTFSGGHTRRPAPAHPGCGC